MKCLEHTFYERVRHLGKRSTGRLLFRKIKPDHRASHLLRNLREWLHRPGKHSWRSFARTLLTICPGKQHELLTRSARSSPDLESKTISSRDGCNPNTWWAVASVAWPHRSTYNSAPLCSSVLRRMYADGLQDAIATKQPRSLYTYATYAKPAVCRNGTKYTATTTWVKSPLLTRTPERYASIFA